MKPCLIIGSGFHSWVLGNHKTALSSWDTLIDEASKVLQVSRPSQTLPPVLRWERLLEISADNGYRQASASGNWIPAKTIQSHDIEADAKLAVKVVLDRHHENYPFQSTKAQFILDEIFGTVISLNFDNCWTNPRNFTYGSMFDTVNTLDLTDVELKRLHCFVKSNAHPMTKVWFPNGSVNDASTIRMGLYDYGSQPYALKTAFNLVKSYERENLKIDDINGWRDYEKRFEEFSLNHSELGKETDSRINHWVAHFLYRPIYLAGVGLSTHESGLWWLLSQRARNHSRLPYGERPKTIILVHADSYDRKFWANRPFGVETLVCDNWEFGWEELLDLAGKRRTTPGMF
jgi:hypothetical protein